MRKSNLAFKYVVMLFGLIFVIVSVLEHRNIEAVARHSSANTTFISQLNYINDLQNQQIANINSAIIAGPGDKIIGRPDICFVCTTCKGSGVDKDYRPGTVTIQDGVYIACAVGGCDHSTCSLRKPAIVRGGDGSITITAGSGGASTSGDGKFLPYGACRPCKGKGWVK